jgi:integrase/recombinase XerC
VSQLATVNQAAQFAAAELEMLYSSGIRPDELLGLDVSSVDLTNQMARVLGKGRKERMVPFGQTARRFLENYLRGIRPLRLSAAVRTSGT